ncbi:MAG: glycoside hydrolase family 55 protein [Gemmataceae bacterium]|nr:glycoside hydrolase family 55 protein [Gemmataceae bacterium]
MSERFGLSVLVAVVFGLASAGRAEDANPDRVHVPADAGLVNVRDHGVKGDGAADDTAALVKLVRANLNGHKTLFFPAGTYLVSDSILWATEKGEYFPWTTWQGEGRGRTTIRLKDNAPGFGDGKKPKPVVKTGCYGGEERQNAAHNCNFFDLTIHTGKGNAGAVALDYCSNNNGAVVRVDLASGDGAGVAGIAMLRDAPGPALVQHVRVQGFDTGIALGHMLFGMTFEHVRLEGQNRVGFFLNGNAASVRKLTSVNAVPAVRTGWWSSNLVLIDSDLTGGDPKQPAVDFREGGVLLLRNVKTSGYQSAARIAVEKDVKSVPAGEVQEFLHGESFALFANAAKGRTLDLPAKDAPAFFGGPDDWASAAAHGARGDGKADDSAAVQKAIDSGKAVVYLPRGEYRLATPVVVRGKVRRVVGFHSSFTGSRGKVLFRFENADHPVSFERFNFFDGGKLEHAGGQPVTLRHVTGPEKNGLVTTATGRVWFFEDVCHSHFTLPKGCELYARQFNCEPEPPGAGFINDGGLVWVLGLKTEFGSTIGVTKNRGRTEVLGGLMLPAQGFKDKQLPAFVVEDSQFSATWNEISFGTGNYRNVVRETRDGKTRNLQPRGEGTQRCWPLYTTEGSK